MEAALLGASVVAAFVAGSVALFAPCCITVLLPAYFASAFHQKERMLAMTIVFFAGIAVILVPVGLGAGFLTQIFGQYHNALYVAGGILMILLGGASLAGKRLVHVKLPFRAPALDVKRPWSVFLLGVFSGAATSCCAPVLAGVMTLAVLSGSFWNAVIVSIAYVFGMTVPLFVSAYFYDRWNLRESLLMRGATVKIPLRGRVYALHSTNLVAAAVFFGMGGLLLGLGATRNAYWSPHAQAALGTLLTKQSVSLLNALRVVPDWVWAIIIILLFAFFFASARRRT